MENNSKSRSRFLAGVPLRLAVEEDFYYYTTEDKDTYKHFNVHHLPFFYYTDDGLQYSFTRVYNDKDLRLMKERIRNKISQNLLFVVDSYLPGEVADVFPTYQEAKFK
jgi:hypothetical protein